MKSPKKGCFKGVLGSRLGLSLFRSDSVLASWPALSAQSPEILFGLGAVLSPAGDCVWLGSSPRALLRRALKQKRLYTTADKFSVLSPAAARGLIALIPSPGFLGYPPRLVD